MKILVAGSDGYIGSSLYAQMGNRHEVIGCGSLQGMQNLHSEDIKSMGVDLVVNCATVTERDVPSYVIGSKSDEVNVHHSYAFFKSIKAASVPLIHLSTKDVYGPCYEKNEIEDREMEFVPKKLIDDQQPFNPTTLYGKSKLISEIFAEGCENYAIIRLSTIYGDKHIKSGNWMSNLINKMISNQNIMLANDGKQFRDPLHVSDLANLVELIYEKKAWRQKLNAGGGEENIISLREYFSIVKERLTMRGIVFDAKVEKFLSNDYGFAFNNNLAYRLGWSPKVMVRSQVEKLIEFSLQT